MKILGNQNKLKLIKYGIFFVFLLDFQGYSETNYLPPDPFLIIGDNNDISSAEEISKKISKLQDQNKTMRSKILSLQDLLASRFKDRIELSIEVVSSQVVMASARLRTCCCGAQATLAGGQGTAQKASKLTFCTVGVTVNCVIIKVPASVSACQLPAPSWSSIAPLRSRKPNCSLGSTKWFSIASRE